jgi:hypothetical protein
MDGSQAVGWGPATVWGGNPSRQAVRLGRSEDPENDLVKPAVEGVANVLESVAKAKVRVPMRTVIGGGLLYTSHAPPRDRQSCHCPSVAARPFYGADKSTDA